MGNYNVGDKLTITITGTVRGGPHGSHDSCHSVKDGYGYTHYVFLDGTNRGNHEGLQIVPTPEVLVPGKAYEDARGEVFIRDRDNDGWVDLDADCFQDDYPLRPLTLLVKEEVK